MTSRTVPYLAAIGWAVSVCGWLLAWNLNGKIEEERALRVELVHERTRCLRTVDVLLDSKEERQARVPPVAARLDAIEHVLHEVDVKVGDLVGADEPAKVACYDDP